MVGSRVPVVGVRFKDVVKPLPLVIDTSKFAGAVITALAVRLMPLTVNVFSDEGGFPS